jgi:hypothetical protein
MGSTTRPVLLLKTTSRRNTMHSLLDLALAGQLHLDRSSVTLTHLHLRDLLGRHSTAR